MQKQQAFTLIEISIVIVMVGLLIAGVITGQNLVRSAQDRKLISTIERIKSAIDSYELKYRYLPGDHSKASEYFSACGTTVSANGVVSNCDGDGDKKVEGIGEGIRVTEHLMLSKIWLEQNVSNLLSPWNSCNKPKFYQGGNVHGMKYNGYDIGFAVGNSNPDPSYAGADSFILGTRVSLTVGNWDNCHFWIHGFATQYEIYKIDKKIDDGVPDKGQMVTSQTAGNACRPTTISTYDISATNDDCAFNIILRK